MIITIICEVSSCNIEKIGTRHVKENKFTSLIQVRVVMNIIIVGSGTNCVINICRVCVTYGYTKIIINDDKANVMINH